MRAHQRGITSDSIGVEGSERKTWEEMIKCEASIKVSLLQEFLHCWVVFFSHFNCFPFLKKPLYFSLPTPEHSHSDLLSAVVSLLKSYPSSFLRQGAGQPSPPPGATSVWFEQSRRIVLLLKYKFTLPVLNLSIFISRCIIPLNTYNSE